MTQLIARTGRCGGIALPLRSPRSTARGRDWTMGFLRHRNDVPDGRRFQMREKLASIGDDSWIEDDRGDRVYKVDGKAARARDTFVLEDRAGHEVAKIQERKLHVRDTMDEREGHTVARLHKALVGIRDRFKIDIEGGDDLD